MAPWGKAMVSMFAVFDTLPTSLLHEFSSTNLLTFQGLQRDHEKHRSDLADILIYLHVPK